MSRKSRGCDYERKLVHLLYSQGYTALRVAGSGSIRYPAPDVIASNGTRVIAFEVKSTQSDKVYLKKDSVNKLIVFSERFKAEPIIAVHLLNKGWYFKEATDLLKNKVLRLDEKNMHRQF